MENKFFERTIEDAVRNVSETFPVLLLTGPRQVGKTTLLKKNGGKGTPHCLIG